MAKQLYPIIAPSILAANFFKLGEEVTSVLNAGAEWIHFDVMDNHYVPNLSFGPMVCDSLRKNGITAPIDVHLMVEPVDALVTEFSKVGADLISFHPEASKHVDRTLQLIKESGCQTGIVLNPATPISYLDYCLDKVDLVLLMSVNPGYGGQTFIPSVIQKIKDVRRLLDAQERDIRLEVDGGVNLHNIKAVFDAGADTFVMGSAIFKTDDYSETIQKAKQQLSI